MIVEGPFFHVSDAGGADAVDDEVGVVGGAEVAAEEGIGGPDFGEEGGIGEDFGGAGDADLVVTGVEIAKFDAGIGGDLGGFAVGAEVGDIDGEAVGADGGDGAEAGLGAVEGGEHGEFGVGHDG